MKPHKWAKEIKAWADGAEIETQLPNGQWEVVHDSHHLFDNHYEYRIKPQEPEPKCKEHPEAPHGFCRDASHSEGRFVCECEFWEEPKEPQYLYVYKATDGRMFFGKENELIRFDGDYPDLITIGKIKLEDE